MSGEVIFEIARFGVDTDEEVLIDRAQLLRNDAVLVWRVDDGQETLCDTTDVVTAIGEIPALRDVNPDQVTRVVARPEVAQELPLALLPTGYWKDIDESLWSEAMSSEHLDIDGWEARSADPYRAIYVNEQRWHSTGDLLLPGDGKQTMLTSEWAWTSVFESGTMNSGITNGAIGLLTPTIVAEICTPDGGDFVDEDEPLSTTTITQWDGRSETAGQLLASWVTSGPAQFYFYYDGTHADPKFFVQLFIEAASSDELRVSCTARELIAASGFEMDYFRRGDGEPPYCDFGLGLNIERPVIDAALMAIAKEDTVYANMITAARHPDSPEARARDERVEAIQAEFPL